MTNPTMTQTCPALESACRDALVPTPQTGWRVNLTSTLTVRIPGGETGTVRCIDVLSAQEGRGLISPASLYVWQGARLDLWHVSQLRLA